MSSASEFKTGEFLRVSSMCGEANPIPDALGQTPLFYAVQRTSDEEALALVGRLVDAPCFIDPKIKDAGGQSALFYAAASGNVETVKRLIELGCGVDEKDNLSQTPLFYASRDGRVHVAAHLIEAGASVSNTDRNGQTPLFYAARDNRREVVDLLLSKGAAPFHVDVSGRTPSYFARLSQHTALAEFLDSLPGATVDSNGRKRCRLVVSGADGVHRTPTVEELEWIESKFPDICVWSKTGPIAATPLPTFASLTPTIVRPAIARPAPVKKAAPPPPPPKPVWVTVARQMVSELFKKEDAWIFLRPVDPVRDMCPDYLSVIKEPMDLGSIRKKMHKYVMKAEFLRDIGLVFSNCKSYNKPGTLPEVLCSRVEAYWNELLERNSFMQLPDTSAPTTAPAVVASTPSGTGTTTPAAPSTANGVEIESSTPPTPAAVGESTDRMTDEGEEMKV